VAEESTEPLDMELCTDTDDNIPTEILIGSNETEWGFAYCLPEWHVLIMLSHKQILN
jgi:hypothetical protein